MEATSFGECVCGRPRSEHSAAALASVKSSHSTALNSPELRARFVKDECVSCEEYVLDMGNDVPFGQCVCGESKSKHSQLALAVRRRPSRDEAATGVC